MFLNIWVKFKEMERVLGTEIGSNPKTEEVGSSNSLGNLDFVPKVN